MEQFRIELQIRKKKTEELSQEEYSLREAAIRAAERAYAPYSNFQVGAAVLLENGEIVEGNNQENAAYPSGLCAERVAVFTAGAAYPEKPVKAIAIIAIKNGLIEKSISPCGACRQVMLETEQRYGRNIQVMLCGLDNSLLISSVSDLLPLNFSKINLE
jgi:cytidine deaminase